MKPGGAVSTIKTSPKETPRVGSLRGEHPRLGAPSEEGFVTLASPLSRAEGEAAGGARPGAG